MILQPLRCKGWDRGAVEFLAATMLDFTDQGSKPALWKRLSDVSCPGIGLLLGILLKWITIVTNSIICFNGLSSDHRGGE